MIKIFVYIGFDIGRKKMILEGELLIIDLFLDIIILLFGLENLCLKIV